MFYEIIRLTSDSPDREDFDAVMKLIRRGWFRKALDYLSQWDYGGENYDTARVYGRLYDTPTDPQEPSDRVLYERDGYNICYCDPSRNGGYEAVYLTAPVPEEYKD